MPAESATNPEPWEWELFTSLVPADDTCRLEQHSQLFSALLIAAGRRVEFDTVIDPADGILSLRARFHRTN